MKAELNSDKKEKKKEAVKKVIASMTVGKDVRCVHPPVPQTVVQAQEGKSHPGSSFSPLVLCLASSQSCFCPGAVLQTQQNGLLRPGCELESTG